MSNDANPTLPFEDPWFHFRDARLLGEKAMGMCWQRMLREREAARSPRPALASCDGLTVRWVPLALAKQVIRRYEWLGTMGMARQAYGLFDPEGGIIGVACFGFAGGPESRDVCGTAYRDRTIALVGGACVHWAPPNAATYLIRRAVAQAARDHGWCVFYAYADPEANETGYVYQASNWHYIGQGIGRTAGRAREVWQRPDGRIVTDRMLRYLGWSKADAAAAGWTLIERPPKHKYVWLEGDKRLRRTLLAALRYPLQPYPKAGKVDDAAVPA